VPGSGNPGGVPGPQGRGFEWFVAWRHLRDPERRSHLPLIVGLIIVLLSGGLVVASYLVNRRYGGSSMFATLPSLLGQNLRLGGVIGLALAVLILFFGVLRSSAFNFFTALSVLGVFFGTWAPVVTLSVMSGFETDLKTKIRGAKADVVVSTADDAPFTDYAEVRRRIDGVPGVAASTPFVESEVLVRAGSTGAGIILRGIDPESAPAVLDLGRILREGKVDDLVHPERLSGRVRFGGPFDDLDRDDAAKAAKATAEDDGGEDKRVLPAIILGEELFAHTLRVFIGSKVEVICPLCNLGPSGPIPGYGELRVAGHFYSGMYEYDLKLAYVTLAEAQRFFHMKGEVTGIDVRTRTPEDSRAVSDALQKLLGPRYEVQSWEQLNKGLFAALRLEKLAMFVVLAFIALVASFSIVSTLIMTVTQKSREVAILKSMGSTDGAIRRIFFAEGLYIGLLGLTVGVSVGVIYCKLIMRYGLPLPTDVYYINKLPVVLRSGEIGAVAGLALLLCCLATVYPAFLASRVHPVEGLRYE
jgi:lipoprotein-releasing system permease protein